MFELVVTAGPLAGRHIEVDRELVVGRVNSDLRIDDPEVSRRHVAIRPVQGGIEVEDLGSLNGTIVNNLRISKPTHVVAGDSIEIGATRIRVEATGEDGATVMRPAAEGAQGGTLPAPPEGGPAAVQAPAAQATPAAAQAAPSAQAAPAAGAAGGSNTEVVSGNALRYTYSGQRFLLGVGEGFYGIWDRAALTIPTRKFAQTDAGWAEAWSIYAAWEPNAERVGE